MNTTTTMSTPRPATPPAAPRKPRKNRWIGGLIRKLVIIAIIGAVCWGAYTAWKAVTKANEPPAPEIKYTDPTRRDISQVFKANGNIVPALSTEIRSEVTGIISAIHVQPGDAVTTGQKLLDLDQSEISLRIAELRLQIESARLRAEKSRGLFERRAKLSSKNFINPKDLFDAEIDARIAENDLAAQQARLRTEEVQLTRAAIVAPYAGVVLDLLARPGLVVTGAQAGREGTILMTVADLSRMKVEAEINEVDVASLVKGMKVKLTFDAAPKVSAEGTVDYISPSALSRRELSATNERGSRSSGGGGGGTVRNFPIDIGFQTADPKIRPGMTAKMEVPLTTVKDALSLEIGAVFTEEEETFVFIQKGGELVKHPVKVGINDSKFVEIKEGLDGKEKVSLSRPPRKPDPNDKTGKNKNAKKPRM